MNANNGTMGSTVVDASGSPVLAWGENDRETVAFVEGALTAIQDASKEAGVSTEYAAGLAAYREALRGQATMLGLALSLEVDVFGALRSYLLASRDHEGELGEVFARKGELGASRPHSARRGWLDSTVYEMGRAMSSLEALKAYEAGRAAR